MFELSKTERFQLDRKNWLSMRTLLLLRWMAIFGQLGAITVAQAFYKFDLPIGPALMVVCLAVSANLFFWFVYPENKRLSERESLASLLFDLLLLAALLFLMGGLTNPFALLILAPVIIAASALDLRATLTLGLIAATATTILAVQHFPLRQMSGETFDIPRMFVFGFWLSILIGIAFLGFFSRRISTEVYHMSEALLATQMALAREQKLTDLGGVVAAAAHELGTPLATIKLVSVELEEELSSHPEWQEDAKLISDQADRCRLILREMGKTGKDDLHLHQTMLSALVHAAAEPHVRRGKEVVFSFKDGAPSAMAEPEILRKPELIHGIRNLVQNAVDFAETKVWIDGTWSESSLTLRISDDGQGFPSQVLGRIGDPFLRSKPQGEAASRLGYEGMGLGLFIAKTLLERTGAELTFANGSDPFLSDSHRPQKCGAIVKAVWRLEDVQVKRASALGKNTPFEG